MRDKVDLEKAFEAFEERWSPRVVASLNGQEVRVAKLEGEFCWHAHEREDEMFWVVRGRLRILLRDREVVLEPGELFVVPRGVEHKPVADELCHVVLFEPVTTVSTGSTEDPRRVENPPPLEMEAS